MATYVIYIKRLGIFIGQETVTAIDSLTAINYHIAAGKYDMFEMRGPDGKIHEYVSPIYEFEARQLNMELS